MVNFSAKRSNCGVKGWDFATRSTQLFSVPLWLACLLTFKNIAASIHLFCPHCHGNSLNIFLLNLVSFFFQIMLLK